MNQKLRKAVLRSFPVSLFYDAWIRWQIRNPALVEKVRTYNDSFFRELGVSREEAEQRHKAVMESLGLPVNKRESFHRVIMAALELSGFRPKTVLELGTLKAETTAYLSVLFPEAVIHTVDLPAHDPIFVVHHPEGDQAYVASRQGRDQRQNVVAHRANTAFINRVDLPDFDLIWLDAGHRYPEVAWDHFYCLGKLREGGWLMSDDVVLPENRYSQIYETIEYFSTRMSSKFRYLLKRENVNEYLRKPKYLGILHYVSGEKR
jgi:predicted O-methyltransferase YrrM